MTTHVANGGHHVIWVLVDADLHRHAKLMNDIPKTPIYVARPTPDYRVGDYYDSKEEQNIRIQGTAVSLGLTRILQGHYIPFPSNCAQNGTVFITVFFQERGEGDRANPGPLQLLCYAFPRLYNYSVVVGYDNLIHGVKMGELWEDEEGRDHFREPNASNLDSITGPYKLNCSSCS